jgi:L-alanine-DL-glutamate epimerase-like enolase superfamily enzyme
MNKIKLTELNYVCEPLIAPFGFKGSSLSELWQIICSITDDFGNTGTGLGVQSVLWSDSSVFSNLSQSGSNAAMYEVTKYAISLLEGMNFTTPFDILDAICEDVYAYAKKITGSPDLRKTFILNALVSIDFALWQLYAKEHNVTDLDTMLSSFSSSLTCRHDKLGMIPLITYGSSHDEIRSLVENGCFLLKIKIGSNPDHSDDRQRMVEWDCNRIKEIHELVKDYETPYTDCGHPMYYLDANGRYDTKERLMKLLVFAEQNGILSRIVILEEPFAENSEINVSNLPVMIAGDESAHSVEDVKHLIHDLGYKAIALKPIAKTLSMTLKMLEEAASNHIPCFCADLTVNPLMVEWNKNIACRINPLPGIKIGVIESNGMQNYINWDRMKSLHPLASAEWLTPDHGIFSMNNDYYRTNGGVLLPPTQYSALLHN